MNSLVESRNDLEFKKRIETLKEGIPDLKKPGLTIGDFFGTVKRNLHSRKVWNTAGESMNDGHLESTLIEAGSTHACGLKDAIRGVFRDLTQNRGGKNPLPENLSIKYDSQNLFYWLPWVEWEGCNKDPDIVI